MKHSENCPQTDLTYCTHSFWIEPSLPEPLALTLPFCCIAFKWKLAKKRNHTVSSSLNFSRRVKVILNTHYGIFSGIYSPSLCMKIIVQNELNFLMRGGISAGRLIGFVWMICKAYTVFSIQVCLLLQWISLYSHTEQPFTDLWGCFGTDVQRAALCINFERQMHNYRTLFCDRTCIIMWFTY